MRLRSVLLVSSILLVVALAAWTTRGPTFHRTRPARTVSEQPLGIADDHGDEHRYSARPALIAPARARTEMNSDGQAAVVVRDGRLSVQSHGRTLKGVLEQISSQSGVFISADQLGEIPVSVQFEDLPLDQGLQRLLKDQDSFFFYGAESQGRGPSLVAVWVYPKGKGQGIVPVPPEKWAGNA